VTEIQSRLPAGWTTSTLGKIRQDRSRGIDPKKHPEERFELYSVPSFQLRTPEILFGREIGSNKRTVEIGTVLLCKINPRINRVWVVAGHSSYPKIASTEWIPFFAVEGVVPQYLCYYLSTNAVRAYLAAHVSGVGGSLMRVNASAIKNYPLPLAPFNEQHRIVTKIEELIGALESGSNSLQAAKARLRQYRQ